MMTTQKKTTESAPFTLAKFTVHTLGMDAHVISYEVRRERDGMIFCFGNPGNGGPGDLHGVKKSPRAKLEVHHPWSKDVQEIAAFAFSTPEVQSFYAKLDAEYGEKERTPGTDDIAMWAEEAGNALRLEKEIKRVSKRTVCWVVDGDLRYLTLRRGQKATAEWRKQGADYVRKNYPGATVYGEEV
jgi:hypothetical protein